MKTVKKLTSDDLDAHPVWKYVEALDDDESIKPITKLPTANSSGKIIGAQFLLANGSTILGLISNLTENPELNEHFATAAFLIDKKWFFLARYHDIDYKKNGPEALAKKLSLPIDEIFPISFDISKNFLPPHAGHMGVFEKIPKKKLSRSAIIALAVP